MSPSEIFVCSFFFFVSVCSSRISSNQTLQLDVCTNVVQDTCFVKHDELLIFNSPSERICCHNCSQTPGCSTWTFRTQTDASRESTCHLRSSWRQSEPTRGPCVTGVISGGPLPPAPAPAPTLTANVTIFLQNATHTINSSSSGELLMGCHTDLGYDHQIYGFYSQRIYGESFENYTLPGDKQPRGNMWSSIIQGGARGFTSGTDWLPLHGNLAQTLHFDGAESNQDNEIEHIPRVGVANMGFNQEGLYLPAATDWTGSFFARTNASINLYVSLEDQFTNQTLADPIAIPLNASISGAWEYYTFTIRMNRDSPTTSCRDFPWDTPPLRCKNGSGAPKGTSAHACVQCAGQFVMALHEQGTVDLDYVELHPGNWGTFGELPVNKDAVTWLRRAGVDAIRTGGTYVQADTDENSISAGYLWKKLRGPRHLRPGPIRSVGGPSHGDITTRGWAIFEAIDMCNAMGIEPIITLNSNETYQDLADLVRYLFAPAPSMIDNDAKNRYNSTNNTTINLIKSMAALRVADGHPDPYHVRWFEIGNEVATQDFGGRVNAMEKAAQELGMGGYLRYACPAECGLDAMLTPEVLALKDRAFIDIHDHGNSLSAAETWVEKFESANSSARLVVWETNTARHDFSRVLVEAQDLIELFNYGFKTRVVSRVESFCMEKSGHDDGLDARQHYLGDQGAVFWLPNMSYAQPPAFVHQMFHNATVATGWTVLNSSVSDVTNNVRTTALTVDSKFQNNSTRTYNGNSLVVIILNSNDRDVNVNLTFRGGNGLLPTQILMSQLKSDSLLGDNPPSDPMNISPYNYRLAPSEYDGLNISLPRYSFSTILFAKTH